MRVVGVNGINCDGEHNIDLLLAALEARRIHVVDVKLPVRSFISARWGGCADGAIVAEHSRDGDILVAHSFGCVRAWYAHKARDYKAIICIAPAMSQFAEWRYPERVHCYWSPKDLAVRIGARLLFHPFGAAGSQGFEQPGILHYETRARHNDYFAPPLLVWIAERIARLARKH